MALSPKIDVRQSQSLVMTPQLQQAIKLLQLTNLELAEYVESQLLENPFLERDEIDDAHPATPDTPKTSDEPQELALTGKGESLSQMDTDFDAVSPDASVADKYEQSREQASPSNLDSMGGTAEVNEWSSVNGNRQVMDGESDFEARLTEDISLHDHLRQQLTIAVKNDIDKLIAIYMVDCIDECGYFRGDKSQISATLGVALHEIDRILQILQGLEPAGVAACDLAECMQLQLADLGYTAPSYQILCANLDLLAKAELKKLAKLMQVDMDGLTDHISVLKSLNPKPGLAYGSDHVIIAIPDVFVRQNQSGGWKVELNTETLPRVLANKVYFAELSSHCTKETDTEYLSEQISNANWLVKSLDQRARTILKISAEIVRQQDTFFVHGVQYLKPLNLKNVAEAVNMHESTVSRVTTNKFIATPRGTFELKYFFSSSIGAATGENNHSSQTVKHHIKEMIDAEPVTKILSDDKIVERLTEINIDIARRTVAKYRESMGIPSSVLRRRQKKQAALG